MVAWRVQSGAGRQRNPEKHVVRTCKQCGKGFSTHLCRIDGTRGAFCSRACNGAWTVRNSQNRVSKAETRFGDALSAAGIEVEAQVSIGPWVVDFADRGRRVAIEFDGDYWHSLPRAKERDARKDAALAALGYSVVRVPEGLHSQNPAAAVALVAGALQ
jgi:very-short-patch-repair endonuclease